MNVMDRGNVRRETVKEQVNRGEEINKWRDTLRKTDITRQKQRWQNWGGLGLKETGERRKTYPGFHLLFSVPLLLGWKRGRVQTRKENEKNTSRKKWKRRRRNDRQWTDSRWRVNLWLDGEVGTRKERMIKKGIWSLWGQRGWNYSSLTSNESSGEIEESGK